MLNKQKLRAVRLRAEAKIGLAPQLALVLAKHFFLAAQLCARVTLVR